MNEQIQAYDGRKTQIVTSVFSVIFSVIASSHHWLHMGILFILGGSTGMMVTMAEFMVIRRFMIIATVVTTLFSIYRMFRKCDRSKGMIALTVLSTLLSIGFVVYTLITFGW